jgi:hypothetical protein
MKDHFDWLGFEVRDRVTGFAGVVDSICFDLYGCVQAAVTPKHDPKSEKQQSGKWVDVKRLVKTGKSRVMEAPKFPIAGEENGPAEKPTRW